MGLQKLCWMLSFPKTVLVWCLLALHLHCHVLKDQFEDAFQMQKEQQEWLVSLLKLSCRYCFTYYFYSLLKQLVSAIPEPAFRNESAFKFLSMTHLVDIFLWNHNRETSTWFIARTSWTGVLVVVCISNCSSCLRIILKNKFMSVNHRRSIFNCKK